VGKDVAIQILPLMPFKTVATLIGYDGGMIEIGIAELLADPAQYDGKAGRHCRMVCLRA
jgi:hypothetical protein